jgi:hypothetical protein
MASFDVPRHPLPVLFDALILLGAGVASRIRSPELEALRARTRDAMGGEFSRQGQPRVATARDHAEQGGIRLREKLAPRLDRQFEQRTSAVTGMLVWEYLGGPWKPVDRLPRV